MTATPAQARRSRKRHVQQLAEVRLTAAPHAVGPTARQLEAWRFIAGFIEAHRGLAPSLCEIEVGLGLTSRSSVVRLVEGLEVRGMIRRHRHRARAIELLRAPSVPHAPDGAPLHFIPLDRLAPTDPHR